MLKQKAGMEQLKRIILDTEKKQLEHKQDFQDLFSEVFERPMADEQWKHFYINAPMGTTISFVYYHNSNMVAHGGLIPQRLISKNNDRIDYFLQTAVMVRKDYQNLILFKELMDTIDSYVTDRGTFSLAFPNKRTYLPFVKMLGWRLVREYSIRQYKRGTGPLGKTEEPAAEPVFQYEIYKNEPFINWRREPNKFQFLRTADFELIYKDYEGSFEILDVSLKKKGFYIPALDVMEKCGYGSINIAGCFSGLFLLEGLAFEKTVGIPQRMCLYPSMYEKIKYEGIKPSLLLSDVF